MGWATVIGLHGPRARSALRAQRLAVICQIEEDRVALHNLASIDSMRPLEHNEGAQIFTICMGCTGLHRLHGVRILHGLHRST